VAELCKALKPVLSIQLVMAASLLYTPHQQFSKEGKLKRRPYSYSHPTSERETCRMPTIGKNFDDQRAISFEYHLRPESLS
jgi:hypothetical protein